MESEKRLVLICEGGAHTVEYFHKNGVFPGAVVFEATKFREMAPYLTKNDDILVVIKGLTDFSMVEIYALLNDIDNVKDKLHAVTVMSNINLGKIPTPYYLYSGDLFYGSVKLVEKGKVSGIEKVDGETGKSAKKSKSSKKEKSSELHQKSRENTVINAVIEPYKLYNNRGVKFTIYGSDAKPVQVNKALDDLTSKLVNVDLFKTEGENK